MHKIGFLNDLSEQVGIFVEVFLNASFLVGLATNRIGIDWIDSHMIEVVGKLLHISQSLRRLNLLPTLVILVLKLSTALDLLWAYLLCAEWVIFLDLSRPLNWLLV